MLQQLIRTEQQGGKNKATQGLLAWQQRAMERSAKGAHAFLRSRDPGHQLETQATYDGQLLTTTQQLINARAREWEKQWTRDNHQQDKLRAELHRWRTRSIAAASSAPELSQDEVQHIIDRLPSGSSPGPCHTEASFLKTMPEAAVAELTKILRRCEAEGAWPDQMNTTFYSLLPKKPGIGQERPVGLTSMLYRVWTVARKGITDEWLQEKGAWWDTAIKGSGALQAALRRLLRLLLKLRLRLSRQLCRHQQAQLMGLRHPREPQPPP